MIEFSSAVGTYQAVYGKRSFPVFGPGLQLLRGLHFTDDILQRPGCFRVDFDRVRPHPRTLRSKAHFRHARAPLNIHLPER